MRLKPKVKLFLYGILFLIILGVYFFFKQAQKEYEAITNYQECLDAGYPMLATYPEQCKIPGKTFTNQSQKASVDIIATSTPKEKNYKSTSYLLEDKAITLQNGVANIPLDPNSSSTNKIQYFGNEVRGDFDTNGTEDIAFLLTSNSGGSGTFYYVTVALSDIDHTYKGTNMLLLGDRIAPQSTELKNGEIIVNYADRKPNDPMSMKPSYGVSRHFKVINNTLVEVTE